MISESIEILPEISAPSNPFPGLRSFELHESHLFFGRDEQREKLVSKLAAARFVAVVGASGSGKSSLVRAGLLPALLGGMMVSAGSNWRLAVFRPGNDPIGNLARALNAPRVFGSDDEQNAAIQTDLTEATLRRGNRGLVDAARQAGMPEADNFLVVVDQFEELFRFAREAESEAFDNDAAAFVKLLLEARLQRELNIFVVLTMRSDFLGDCSRFWDLPEAINESQYLIPRLTREQLRRAITGPVRVARADMTTSLVNRVLNDIGDDQDQLPILQHALMRTWQEWKEKRLRVEVQDAGGTTMKRPHREVHQGDDLDLCCYEASGGMSGALSRHADEALAELKDERRREIAEKLFKRLTEKGEDNREIRLPSTIGEICEVAEASEPEVIEVVEAFRRADRSFLMPPQGRRLDSKTMIDISHESLVRVWQTLNRWVEEESESAKQYKRLDDTAERHREKRAELLRGTELQFALEWREREKPNKAWAHRYGCNYDLAMSVLEESRNLAEAEAEQKDYHQKKELRRTHNFVLVLALGLLVVSALAIYAFTQRTVALEGQISTRQLNALASIQLAGKLFDERNYGRSIELLDLFLPSPSAEAGENPRSFYWYYVWRGDHNEQTTFRGYKYRFFSVSLSPDGRLLASASISGITVWDLQTKEEVATLNRHNDRVTSVAFSPDGRLLASASLDKTVKLWDVEKMEPIATLNHSDGVDFVAFAAVGGLLATASRDKTIKLWDVPTKQEVATFKGHKDLVRSVAFTTDGRLLASASNDSTVKLWDVQTKKVRATLTGHENSVQSVAFSPDGRLLASASTDNTVKLWDVRRTQEWATLKGHADSVEAVAFTANGTLASASLDNTVKLWDVKTKREIRTFKGHEDYVVAVAASADGRMLATASWDRTVKLWLVQTPQEEAAITTNMKVASSALSSDGRLVACGGNDVVKLWDVQTKAKATLRGHSEEVTAVAFSADGRLLASGSMDTTVKLWDVQTKQALGIFTGHKKGVRSVAFSADSRLLATAGEDHTVKLWDVQTKQEVATLEGQEDVIFSVAFSSDGKLLASGCRDGTIWLWDVQLKTHVPLVGHLSSVTSVAFTADRQLLASASADKTIVLWGVQSRKAIATLKGHSSLVNAVTFTPDGKLLASASHDKTVKLWDVLMKQEVATLKGHADRVTSVAFTADGRLLASASDDKTVRLWIGATDAEVAAQRNK